MFRPRLVTILVASGAKGGVGKSTIAASLAALFDVKVAVLDLGIDGNTTVAAYHKAYIDDTRGILDYLLLGLDFDIVESKVSKNVGIVPAGRINGVKASILSIPNRSLIRTRYEKALLRLCREGYEVAIVDTPSNAELLTTTYITILYYSDIICLVTEPTLSAVETLHKWWSNFSKILTRGSQILNLVVNKYIEKLHSNVNMLRKYVQDGVLIKIPFDAAVLVLSTNAELPVMYSEPAKFNKALNSLLKVLEEQVTKYIGVQQLRL